MQPIRRLSVAAALVVAGVLLAAPAGARAGERTRSYDVAAELDGKGRLAVIETIAYDFGPARRHGIVREIPTRPAATGGTFVDNVSVRSPDGAPAVRTVERGEYRTTVRIGDPERTVTGRHTYELRYTLGGTAVPYGGGVLIEWDALGTGWRTGIDRANVRLTAPAPPDEVRCHAGPELGHGRCADVRTAGRTVDVTETALARGAGVRIEASYPRASVAADPLRADRARVDAQERRTAPPPPVADARPAGGEKVIWGLIIGGILLGVVALGLASRGQWAVGRGSGAHDHVTGPGSEGRDGGFGGGGGSW